MIPIVLVGLLTAVTFYARLPLFESVFAILLLLPAVFIAVAPLVGDDFQLAYCLLLALICGALIVRGHLLSSTKDRAQHFDTIAEFTPIAVFAIACIFFNLMCLRWPDFSSIGERLRDYALLAQTIRTPVQLQEPWFVGYELNYYGYWYRFGHMLHVFGGLQTWDVYHQLQSLTFALFFASIFRLFSRYLGFGFFSSLAVALLVSCGSNIDGVYFLYNHEGGWWRPSRVIPGVIHEFPIWSFLLGDNHPHYLNLPATLFFLLLLLRSTERFGSRLDLVLRVLTFVLLPPVFLYGANPWEMPIWPGILACILLAIVLSGSTKVLWRYLQTQWRNLGAFTLWDILVGLFVLCGLWGLYVGLANITPIGAKVRLVEDPIARTEVLPMLRHFGLPLLLIAAISTASLPRRIAVFWGVLQLASLCFLPLIYPFLLLTLTAQLCCVCSKGRALRGSFTSKKLAQVLVGILGVCGLGLIIVPEFAFLDDPYGGAHERMNTVFKAYYPAWWMLHICGLEGLFAVLGLEQGRERPLKRGLSWLVVAVGLLTFTSFFIVVSQERSTDSRDIDPVSRGLSRLDGRFPGVAATIKRLDKLPEGTVLEAQGRAYSETSFVSTLTHNSSFLGWANHIGLLYPWARSELTRREDVTKAFYATGSCEDKQRLLRENRIKYAVVGPLERKEYHGLEQVDYSCLKELIAEGQFKVFAP